MSVAVDKLLSSLATSNKLMEVKNLLSSKISETTFQLARGHYYWEEMIWYIMSKFFK